MATEGLPVQLACRLRPVAESGLPRMAITATVPARDSTCLADRTDPCRAFRVSGHLRCPARPRLGLTLGHGQVEMLMARACPAPQRRTPRQCTVNYE